MRAGSAEKRREILESAILQALRPGDWNDILKPYTDVNAPFQLSRLLRRYKIKGRVLLIIDELDRIVADSSSSRDEIIEMIFECELDLENSKNSDVYVVTVVADWAEVEQRYTHPHPDYKHIHLDSVRVKPFSPSEVEQLVNDIFDGGPQCRSPYLPPNTSAEQLANPIVNRTAGNPLLVNALLEVYLKKWLEWLRTDHTQALKIGPILTSALDNNRDINDACHHIICEAVNKPNKSTPRLSAPEIRVLKEVISRHGHEWHDIPKEANDLEGKGILIIDKTSHRITIHLNIVALRKMIASL